MIALVGPSISLIPGPPFGPSYLTTITCPFLILLLRIASIADSSELKTIAFPVKLSPSFPDIFATAPSGAKFPYKITR